MATTVTLPNLYCLPSDVYDDLGVDGVQLRLDDNLQATGQTLTVTATAAQGATTLNITALAYPLIAGTVLEFSGANIPAVVEVILTATAVVGATSLSVVALPSAINAQAIARDSGVNVALAARLLKGCQYATSQVKLYCCCRYNDDVLATTWSAKRWATALAKRYVCRRRAQGAPKAIEEEAKETLEELRKVQSSQLHVEDIGTRVSGWPFITNTSIDVSYDYNKIRVEPQLSEGTPTFYGQYVDWNASLNLEL